MHQLAKKALKSLDREWCWGRSPFLLRIVIWIGRIRNWCFLQSNLSNFQIGLERVQDGFCSSKPGRLWDNLLDTNQMQQTKIDLHYRDPTFPTCCNSIPLFSCVAGPKVWWNGWVTVVHKQQERSMAIHVWGANEWRIDQTIIYIYLHLDICTCWQHQSTYTYWHVYIYIYIFKKILKQK